MSNIDDLPYFKKYEERKKEIQEKKKEVEDGLTTALRIDIAEVSSRATDILPRVRRIGQLLSWIGKYVENLEIDLKYWQAKRKKEIKKELLEKRDERAKISKPSFEVRDSEIKWRLDCDPIHKKLLHRIALIRYYYNDLEKNAYWPAHNAIKILGIQQKFAFANEASYRPEARDD